jgi:hypothetical protein
MIKDNSAAVGNVSGTSWSSSETSSSNAFDSDGAADKSLSKRIRCVRKDMKYDFGTSSNYYTSGYAHVRENLTKSASNEHGWVTMPTAANVSSISNFSKQTLTFYQDAAQQRNTSKTFQVNLGSGTYDIRVYYGWSSIDVSLRATAESGAALVTVDGPLISANVFSSVTLSNVSVTDGILDLALTNAVTNKYCFVNGIDIAPAGKLRAPVP